MLNLTDSRFGRLRVLKLIDKRRYGREKDWLCVCDCGKQINVTTALLRTGHTKSCGCLLRDLNTERKSLPAGQAHLNQRLRTYKKAARLRNLEFSIEREDFKRLVSMNCFYCGALPISSWIDESHNGDFLSNGLDRVDSSKGYTLDNVVPCCKRCNVAKNDMTEKEFRAWIIRLYSYYITRNETT